MTPTRPVLRWYGGKWRIAPWIISHFPAHEAYCEPYGGAASVLLRKPKAKIETWNDLHGRLVNFFQVLRDQPDELIRRIVLTPYARAEHEQARILIDNPLEDARRFYVLGNQGRVGAAGGRANHGWKYQIDPRAQHREDPATFAAVEHLYAVVERFRHVQIECDTALAVLQRYDTPGTLHYVDPPYVQDARADRRNHRSRYLHEMDDDGHRALAEVLHGLEGMVVLSGYPSDLYRDLYGDWQEVTRIANTDASEDAVECLWSNPAARARAGQLNLLESTA